MSLLRYLFALYLLLFSLNLGATPSIYTIEGKFEAVFPSQPKLEGELNIENSQTRYYYSIDELNKTFYSAGISSLIGIGKTDDVINIFIKGFIASKAKAMNGSVSFQDIKKQGSDYQAKFTVELKLDGIPMRSQSTAIYHNGYFYQWSVLSGVDSFGISNSSNAFNNYIKYFRVK